MTHFKIAQIPSASRDKRVHRH